jgi:hypothetical protein
MVRGALDSELVADPAPAPLALNDPADAALVPVGNAGRDRDRKRARRPAFATPLVKELLHCKDGMDARTICALHQQPTIVFIQWKSSRLEGVKYAAVDDVIRRLEVFAAADMDRGERRQDERDDFGEAVH